MFHYKIIPEKLLWGGGKGVRLDRVEELRRRVRPLPGAFGCAIRGESLP